MFGRKVGRRKPVKKKIIIAVTVILAVLLIIGSGVYALFNHYIGLMNREPDNSIVSEIGDDDLIDGEDSDKNEIDELEKDIIDNLEAGATELVYNDNVFNILLIGTDEREGQGRGRSDTMMIFSINKETKQIIMTSLLRDIYLSIPGITNGNRINAAYAFGGASLLIDTIESNFGIRIDRYVQVGFTAFTDIIDEVGGVNIDLTDAEVDYINNRMDSNNKLSGSGTTYNLNGTQALQYSRIRYLDSDFVRTERQRNVMSSLLTKAKNMNILEINSLLNKFLPNVTTDLTEGEMFSLVLSSLSILKYDVVSCRIPVDGSWSSMTVRKMAVLRIDFSKNRNILIETIYGQN